MVLNESLSDLLCATFHEDEREMPPLSIFADQCDHDPCFSFIKNAFLHDIMYGEKKRSVNDSVQAEGSKLTIIIKIQQPIRRCPD
jgi:hypothetical protein